MNRAKNTTTRITHFLGPDAAAGGAIALLGLGESMTEEGIVHALESRLAMIRRHPEARTPEADEVCLALHAAAVQMLDALSRKKANMQSGSGKKKGNRSKRQKPQQFELEQDAIMTLARYGGWNRRSLHRLVMLAFARGATPVDVANVLKSLALGVGTKTNSITKNNRTFYKNGMAAEPVATAFIRTPTRKQRTALRRDLLAMEKRDEPQEEDKTLALWVGGLAIGLTLIVAIAFIIIVMSTSHKNPVLPGEESDSPVIARSTPDDLPMAGGAAIFPWQGKSAEKSDESPKEKTSPAFANLPDALVGLDAAAQGLAIDANQAINVFSRAITGIGMRWVQLTPSQRRAAQHDVVEFVYNAVQNPQQAKPVIAAIADPAAILGEDDRSLKVTDIWPASWSLGLLARLAHEQDLGANAAQEVSRQLRVLIGSTVVVSSGFEPGVQAGLWLLVPKIIDSDMLKEDAGKAWEKWIAVANTDPVNAQRLILSALEWVLVSADEPTDNEAVRIAIESLTLGCDWTEQSLARSWLIRMFDDTRVSAADLHAMTTTLSRRSAAPGIDLSMALPVVSSSRARAMLRERYARVWSIDLAGPTLDDLAADWLKAAHAAVTPLANNPSRVQMLSAAVNLSRLSEAARLRQLGMLDQAGIVIDEYDRPVELELSQVAQQRQPPDSRSDQPPMSQWALAYLSAQRDFSQRLKLLDRASRMTIVDTVDAEVLVTDAVRGSPAKLRTAARQALLAQKPSVVLTLAMLEVAPAMPRTQQNAQLVSALTTSASISTKVDDWRLRIRRQLVQAALEQLAAQGDEGLIDTLADLLSKSDSARVVGADSTSPSAGLADLDAGRAVSMLRARWERAARQGGLGSEVLEVERVMARHASRTKLAQGPVQAFAAEQFSAFELMAIAVASERINRAAEVRQIREQIRLERSQAKDIVAQILLVERGFVRLWAVELGQEQPE